MSRRGEYRRWSEEELAFLRENMATMTTRQMCDKLGRTWQATDGMKRYLARRDEYRRHTTPCSFCGNPIHRRMRRGQVRIYCNTKCSNNFHNGNGKIRRAMNRSAKFWTDKEQQFLQANYGLLTGPELSAALHRGLRAVYHRAFLTGLRDQRKWSRNDDAFLALHKSRGWKWCAKQLGRTVWAVKVRARKIGIQTVDPGRNERHRQTMLSRHGVPSPGALIRRRKAVAAKAVVAVQADGLSRMIDKRVAQ